MPTRYAVNAWTPSSIGLQGLAIPSLASNYVDTNGCTNSPLCYSVTHLPLSRHDLANLLTGGDLCLPQLGLCLDYKPGNYVLLRGAELEHFVSDWTGTRYFVLFTNHQSVRNYAYRRLRRLPPLPTDEWYMGDDTTEQPTEVNEEGLTDPLDSDDEYSPCAEMHLDPSDDEGITESDIHGPAYWSPSRNKPGQEKSSTPSDESQTQSNAAPTSVAHSFDRESQLKRRRVETVID